MREKRLNLEHRALSALYEFCYVLSATHPQDLCDLAG